MGGVGRINGRVSRYLSPRRTFLDKLQSAPAFQSAAGACRLGTTFERFHVATRTFAPDRFGSDLPKARREGLESTHAFERTNGEDHYDAEARPAALKGRTWATFPPPCMGSMVRFVIFRLREITRRRGESSSSLGCRVQGIFRSRAAAISADNSGPFHFICSRLQNC